MSITIPIYFDEIKLGWITYELFRGHIFIGPINKEVKWLGLVAISSFEKSFGVISTYFPFQ